MPTCSEQDRMKTTACLWIYLGITGYLVTASVDNCRNGPTYELATGPSYNKSEGYKYIHTECRCMHYYGTCCCCYGWPGSSSWQLLAAALMAILLMNQTDNCNDNDDGGFVGADVSDSVGGVPSENDELGYARLFF